MDSRSFSQNSETFEVPESEFRHGIIYTRTLSTEVSALVSDRLANVEWRPSTVGQKHDVFRVRELIDEQQRHALSAGYDRAGAISADLVAQTRPVVFSLIKEFWSIDVEIISSPQFTRYTKGHFISAHTDSGAAYPDRMFSVVTYLSENYTGGEIFFPKQNQIFHPKMGETIIFPSTFVHGVHPVQSGTKEIFLFFVDRGRLQVSSS